MDCVEHISTGDPVLLFERQKIGIAVGLKQWEKRGIEEPLAESVVRGPREEFVETLRVNTALLRRKLSVPELKIQSMKIGQYSKTTVAITYIEGIIKKDSWKKSKIGWKKLK